MTQEELLATVKGSLTFDYADELLEVSTDGGFTWEPLIAGKVYPVRANMLLKHSVVGIGIGVRPIEMESPH